MIEQDLQQRIAGNGATNMLVSDRVYPVKLPEKQGDAVYPAITYTLISASPSFLNLDGPAGPAWASFQIDCWSIVSEEEAAQVLASLTQPVSQGGIHGFRGWMGASFVQKAAVDPGSIRSTFTPPAHADDLGIYQRSFDLMIVYEI